VLAALCFSELNALYPSAAAIRQYLTAAFNEELSLTVSFAYLLTIVMVIAADSYVVGSAISFVFPGTPVLLWILLILLFATLSNLLGMRIAGTLQDITTYSLLISLAIISVLALSRNGFQLHQPFAALSMPGNLFSAVAYGVFVFSAFEWVTPLAEEVTDSKLIPRGMLLALGLLFISYALYTVAATNLVGIGVLKNSPVPHMLLGQATLGEAGIIWMLVATLLTGVMTFNGGFATASRFLYAAAREATLPAVFARLSPGRAVPWVPVVGLAVISAVVAVVISVTKQFDILIAVGAVLEAGIYAAAGLCVIQLRRREPKSERSFRIPLGWTIPILCILIFTALGIGAALTPNPLPLGITLVLFVIALLYVRTVVPRLRAAEAARRSVLGRRRPPRRPAHQEPSLAGTAPEIATDEQSGATPAAD
jgi:amino acid transporter